MVNPNMFNPTDENKSNQPTGWESVAEMAGKMDSEERLSNHKETSVGEKRGARHNPELQSVYDSIIASDLEDWEAQYEIQDRFQAFNLSALNLCDNTLNHTNNTYQDHSETDHQPSHHDSPELPRLYSPTE